MAVPNFLLWASVVALRLLTVDIVHSFTTFETHNLHNCQEILKPDKYEVSDQVTLVLTILPV